MVVTKKGAPLLQADQLGEDEMQFVSASEGKLDCYNSVT